MDGGRPDGPLVAEPIPPIKPYLRNITIRAVSHRAVLFRPDTELMSCCENIYEGWCPNSNRFAAARNWATEHGLQGRVLTLTKAAGLETEPWKSLTNGGGGRP